MAASRDWAKQLRQRIRDERERRGWSQHALAAKLDVHSTTVTKIESGNRAIHVNELGTLADIFGMSIDVLMGRNPGASDILWAMSKLTSNAQKIAGEIVALRRRLADDLDDVQTAGGKTDVIDIRAETVTAINQLDAVRQALLKLADQFPIPV